MWLPSRRHRGLEPAQSQEHSPGEAEDIANLVADHLTDVWQDTLPRYAAPACDQIIQTSPPVMDRSTSISEISIYAIMPNSKQH